MYVTQQNTSLYNQISCFNQYINFLLNQLYLYTTKSDISIF